MLVVVLCTAMTGCSDRSKPSAAEATPTSKPSAVAAPEMCKEHGVLEAVCTKCNPALAAVFQAKGDWCKEHGFPESFCPTCHPERGGKPAADIGKSDGAPADGTKVRFKTKDTGELAGIQTARAVVRPQGSGVRATARLVYDAAKLAHVNARSAGVIKALKVDVGTRVKKGDTLAIVSSAEVGAERSRVAAARSRVAVAEENLKREQQLHDEGITAKKSLLEARRELDDAKAGQAALAASLGVIAGGGGGGGGDYTLVAPLAGVVTERKAAIGKLVGSDEVLYEIVDTAEMWAELDVPEAELSLVAPEQKVMVTVDGLPGQEFEGAITYIAPSVDPHTRTAKARVPLANPNGALRANMFAEARISVGAARESVLVPRAAVQRAKTVQLVFVRLAEDLYEARRVEVGTVEGDAVEIKKGVRAGEEVATTGSFLLKTETLKESIGAGCCGD
jgi:cobalt-zinc-cadmium efflux system membrane fusion protein